MAVNLQLRAAPNVAENDFSLEGILQAISIANPLGDVVTTNFGNTGGFFNFFGPPNTAPTFTYCLIIPDPNYPGTYSLKGLTTDGGVNVSGPTLFPCIPQAAATPTFGIFIPNVSSNFGFTWTFIFL